LVPPSKGDDSPKRGPGRPRKWADDAERLRAYRERKAAELADPQRLREEVRELRRRVRDLETELGREQAARSKAEDNVHTLRAIIDDARAGRPLPLLSDAVPSREARNRAQRRAEALRRRREGR
jgi:predicted RNase H-like nuclease (RuvC/YqgF family)